MLNICIFSNKTDSMNYFSEKISDTLDENNISYDIKIFDYNVKHIERQYFHAVFIKIDADEKGIKIAEKIHYQTPQTQIIFISEYENLVFKSLKSRPIAFVHPQKFEIKIENIVKTIIKECMLYRNTCLFNFRTKLIGIKITEITYIESMKHDIFLHKTNGKTEKITNTLGHLEKTLSQIGFIRIHSGYLVNYRAISNIGGNFVTLNDNTVLPLSKRRVNPVKKSFSMFIENEELCNI